MTGTFRAFLRVHDPGLEHDPVAVLDGIGFRCVAVEARHDSLSVVAVRRHERSARCDEADDEPLRSVSETSSEPPPPCDRLLQDIGPTDPAESLPMGMVAMGMTELLAATRSSEIGSVR